MKECLPDLTRFLIIMTVIMGLLGVFIAILIYKHNDYKFEKNQKINLLIFEHKKALMAAKLEIQELTFQLISREIHDNVNNPLILSKAQLDRMDPLDPEDVKEKASSSSNLISESLTSLSHISAALNSDRIKGLGLVNALRHEVNRLNISGLFIVETHFSGVPKSLDAEKELLVFRIVQETFNNIIKHSMAKSVDLSLNYHDEHLQLTISDNGKGFNYLLNGNDENGFGLKNMKARTRMLNGKLTITSAPGNGTSVNIKIPYQ